MQLIGDPPPDILSNTCGTAGKVRAVRYIKVGLVQGQRLNQLRPQLTKEAGDRIRRFAGQYLWPMPPETITVEFPWNRMFELGIQLQKWN